MYWCRQQGQSNTANSYFEERIAILMGLESHVTTDFERVRQTQ